MPAAVREDRGLLLPRDGPAGRVVWRIDIERPRARRQRIQQALQIERPASGAKAQRETDCLGAENLRNLHQVGPHRRNDDHPISRSNQRLGGEHQRRHARVGDCDIVGGKRSLDAVQPRQVSGDTVTQCGNPQILGVEGVAALQGFNAGLADKVGGDLVGFAEPEREQVRFAHAGIGNFANLGTAQRLHGGSRSQQAGVHGVTICGMTGIFSRHQEPAGLSIETNKTGKKMAGTWKQARPKCRGKTNPARRGMEDSYPGIATSTNMSIRQRRI